MAGKTYFNPGCALSIYKPEMEHRILKILNENYKETLMHNVCVYCVSCVKSMHIGGKTPRYLADLLMGEDTDPQESDTVKWHDQLQVYIDAH